ncbi:MAG TPA: metal ABC transporter permease [Candidatus Eremiobacteraceae bacterium]|nr:metal ABC transporter permease [Candidatus Eremiobacteraceae bacterium]
MIHLLADPMENAFMVRALVAATFIGLTCSVIGVFVVLRNLSFIGDGLAHASFAGIVVAYMLKANLYVGGLIVAVLTALGIGSIAKRSELSLDTAIGVLFTAAFALGVLLMSRARSYASDLQDFLFGNILGVDRLDIILVVALAALVLAIVVLFYKELLFSSFDPVMAQASGLPTDFLYYLLLVLLAVTIIVSLQAAGIVLVAALLVTPAATAYQLTTRFGPMMVVSALVGVLSGIIGLYLSYYLDAASGATIVLTATAFFFLAMLFSPRRRSLLSAVLASRRATVRAR